jgi:endonuclease/exonuclease/phosphatase family metal-dependent hydrolase
MSTEVSIATWNAEWIFHRSGRFQSALGRISGLGADILVLTETSLDLIPEEGYSALGGPDWGYPIDENRRKVVLWSKWPIEVADNESVQPSGRHIGATISTPVGPVRVHAVCVPWRDAHVSTGRRDANVWSEHIDFLDSLQGVLSSERKDPSIGHMPIVLAGDFNQRDGQNPYGSDATRHAWSELLSESALREVTPSDIIDRVALSADLQASDPITLDPDGISDHHAVLVKVEAS